MDVVSAKEVNETINAASQSNVMLAQPAREKMVRWVEQNRNFENDIDKVQVGTLVKQWNMTG